MRRLRLVGVGIAAAVFALVLALIGLAVLTARSGDPALWPSAAGVPTAPVLATLPSGLFLDLQWRTGLAAMRKN